MSIHCVQRVDLEDIHSGKTALWSRGSRYAVHPSAASWVSGCGSYCRRLGGLARRPVGPPSAAVTAAVAWLVCTATLAAATAATTAASPQPAPAAPTRMVLAPPTAGGGWEVVSYGKILNSRLRWGRLRTRDLIRGVGSIGPLNQPDDRRRYVIIIKVKTNIELVERTRDYFIST